MKFHLQRAKYASFKKNEKKKMISQHHLMSCKLKKLNKLTLT